MKPQHQRTRIARLKTITHDTGPQAAGRAKLGDLFQQIIVRIKEKGEPRRKIINLETSFDRSFHVSDRVREREC